MTPKPVFLRQPLCRGALRLTVLAGIFAGLRTSLPAHGAAPPELVMSDAENGKFVSAVLFQAVAINLPGNPSTGYTWMLRSTNGNSVVSAA